MKVNIPQSLSEVGVKEEDIITVSEKALNDPCTDGNLRDTNVNAIARIFKEAY